jgi:hypothetical protein
VSVLEAHNDSGAAGGLLLFDMALTRIAFVLVCLGVRAEPGPSEATTELVMPALLQSAAAAVLPLSIGAVVTGNHEHQLPRPWVPDDEHRLLTDALEQVELADRLGIDYLWEVEHHFL